MSRFDVSRDGDSIVLLRSEGPFALPVSQWKLTVQEADRISKILAEAVKSMKKRAQQRQGDGNG